MEMDKEKFMEKLKGLMDMGKKKKNMLEYREVTDYFQDMPISDEQMDMSSKFHAIFKQSVKSIDYAKNIIVIKCYTGMANAACAALDSMNRSGVVGTLAGDDTIFVLMNDDNTAVYFAAELKKMLG